MDAGFLGVTGSIQYYCSSLSDNTSLYEDFADKGEVKGPKASCKRNNPPPQPLSKTMDLMGLLTMHCVRGLKYKIDSNRSLPAFGNQSDRLLPVPIKPGRRATETIVSERDTLTVEVRPNLVALQPTRRSQNLREPGQSSTESLVRPPRSCQCSYFGLIEFHVNGVAAVHYQLMS